jgi:hypothetical protein
MSGNQNILIKQKGSTDDSEVRADRASSESPLPSGGFGSILGIAKFFSLARAGSLRRWQDWERGFTTVRVIDHADEPSVRFEKIGQYDSPEIPENPLPLDPDTVLVIPTKKRELEMMWLADHKQELQQYEGQWIGLEGYNLIAHDRQLSNVTRILKERGLEVPFTMFVPRSTEGIFMGL